MKSVKKAGAAFVDFRARTALKSWIASYSFLNRA
jgi:hypothetical protein